MRCSGDLINEARRAVLLHWNNIEFTGAFFVKERAGFSVASTPVFLAAWNPDEFASSDALFAILVTVNISAFDSDNPSIVSMRVRAVILARFEFGERTVGSIVRVTPY